MRIIYERPDGGVSIVQFTSENPTEEDIRRSVPEGAHWELFEDCPIDRTFRDAWARVDKGKVGVNMAKAREIHMGRIRKVRDEELARLDVEQLRGNEVAARKQTLRDIPATFDLSQAQTPEALDTLWPSELPGRKR